MIFQEKCFSYYILLIDQISLSDCLYFSKHWPICVLIWFPNQAVMSQNLKLNLSFLWSRFVTWQKSQDKTLKALFIIFKGLSVANNYLRPESASFKNVYFLMYVSVYKKTYIAVHCTLVCNIIMLLIVRWFSPKLLNKLYSEG